MVKNLPASARDAGSIPESGRSPGGGHGNPLQYSYLENPSLAGSIQSMRSRRVGHDWSGLALTPPAWMTAWVRFLYSLLNSHVTLGKLVHFAVPQSPHM